MKVSGFSFVRNALKYDYPIVEAIMSILPICDEFIIAIGQSDDASFDLIKRIQSPKIKIIETIWDDSLREGGQVLAVETDKALAEIAQDSDWAFYIQGDEVVHENDLPIIKKGMHDWVNDPNVDGLLFDYRHFYGSYDYVGESLRWYRKEIRIIKNNKKIYSYRDAQGFRKENNLKLNVKPIDAYINHYGWVKDPRAMQKKNEDFNKLWHDDNWIADNVKIAIEYDYSEVDALSYFKGTHPKVMQDRIDRINWKFEFDLSRNNFSIKDKLKRFIEKTTGRTIGYANYKIV